MLHDDLFFIRDPLAPFWRYDESKPYCLDGLVVGGGSYCSSVGTDLGYYKSINIPSIIGNILSVDFETPPSWSSGFPWAKK
jgi:hypothetical protein